VVEGIAGRRHRAIHVGFARFGHLREGFFSGGIDQVDPAAGLRRDPFATDEESVTMTDVDGARHETPSIVVATKSSARDGQSPATR
jgi:hypothetical protein